MTDDPRDRDGVESGGPTADPAAPSPSDAAADPTGASWPVDLRGVTESVVTTLGPNGRWNVAALGLFAGDPVTATTWGQTRTRGNFRRQGEGYVQFVRDPVVFADAALSIVEREEPVLSAADAWVRVAVESRERGTDDGTQFERWALTPVESAVVRERVPTTNRGYAAVIEATVAASRLGVAGYDEQTLRERLAYFADVVDRAGGPREREAIDRIREHSSW